MIPWVQLDSAPVPGEPGAELRLKRRGAEFSIMLGTNELMNSRMGGSEEALARLALARLGDRPEPAILIGGLGMGFTLRAALAELGPASVTVAELVPAVVAWARGPMAVVLQGCLDDPRVSVEETDVGLPIRAAAGAWDAILLDVDNGPEGLSRSSNDALYAAAGLSAAFRALRPGGVLSVWSSGPDAGFTRRLLRAGFEVTEEKVRATGKRGARHVVWVAVRPA
ncbi:hypothetical protein ABGN05_12060 [Aquibium sp. LZ166]|uniref:Spermidine synthase n=1 Tax=Aquibium pacificus TaxID=3153579 RepID=A0ABV3SI21_9HYPH